MIQILLSTYNGEKFLRELLDSLFAQKFQAWQLLIRDDGSSDTTRKILAEYLAKYPEKIFFCEKDTENLKSTRSFYKLLQYSDADYIMFCDQDDIWFPDKIEKTYACMRQAEQDLQENIPVAVFTDLAVTDAALNIIAPSFHKQQKMFTDAVNELHTSLAHSVAPGCTMMLNRSAVTCCCNESTEIPGELVHDHWCISMVSAYGKVFYINEPTIYYRQHGRNVVGAGKISLSYFMKRLIMCRKTLTSLCLLKHTFPIRFSLLKVIYYKLKFALMRSF